MTKDVTDLFETYRECARHIRNTYFSTRESKDWETIDDFNEVNRVLFERLVLYRLQGQYSTILDTAVSDGRLTIVPDSIRMPVMISREPNSGYWDHPIACLEPGDATISFRRYFDWDEHGLIDYRYYRGQIVESVKYPTISGHDILIETIYGRILFTGENETEPSPAADCLHTSCSGNR